MERSVIPFCTPNFELKATDGDASEQAVDLARLLQGKLAGLEFDKAVIRTAGSSPVANRQRAQFSRAHAEGPGDDPASARADLSAASYTAEVPPASTSRARPRRWREVLAFALAQQEAISVRGTVVSHLRRTPTRAEITAARRAAHRLVSSGQATMLRVRPPGGDGGCGSAHLILARPGTAQPSGSLDGTCRHKHRG